MANVKVPDERLCAIVRKPHEQVSHTSESTKSAYLPRETKLIGGNRYDLHREEVLSTRNSPTMWYWNAIIFRARRAHLSFIEKNQKQYDRYTANVARSLSGSPRTFILSKNVHTRQIS